MITCERHQITFHPVYKKCPLCFVQGVIIRLDEHLPANDDKNIKDARIQIRQTKDYLVSKTFEVL